MAYGLINIQKTLAGEDWINTYGVMTDGSALAPISGTDIPNINQFPVTDATTDPNSGTYAGGTSLVHAILGFERLMHSSAVEFSQVYITDGQDNSGNVNNVFQVVDTSFAGLEAAINAAAVAPGSITLQVNRNPVGYSQRRGRIFMRAVMAQGDIGIGNNRLVDFATPQDRTDAENRLDTAITSSLLGNYMAGGSQVTSMALAIPSYNALTGALDGAVVIESLVVRNIVSRQVKRGRKEK
jgi:hypothetical protein